MRVDEGMESNFAMTEAVNHGGEAALKLPKKFKHRLSSDAVPNGTARHENANTDAVPANETSVSKDISFKSKKPKTKTDYGARELVKSLSKVTVTSDDPARPASSGPYLPSETFREHFWLLSKNSTTDNRMVEQATLTIIQHIRNEYKKTSGSSATNAHATSMFVEDLHYTIMRLVSGLASPRSVSVFASALTLLLAEPYATDIPFGYLLQIITHTLTPVTTDKLSDDEIKHMHDGLLLGYSILFNSTADVRHWQQAAESTQLFNVLRKLRELSEIKATYRTMADQLFASILIRFSRDSGKLDFSCMLRKCYPEEFEALQSKTLPIDHLTDRMLFVSCVAAKCGESQMLERIMSNAETNQKWKDIANLLRISWLEESQPLQVERLTMLSCLVMEHFIEKPNIEFFTHFWHALCETSLHQDGRVTGKTRYTFLLASFMLTCIINIVSIADEHKLNAKSNVSQAIIQILEVILSDALIDLCVKCIKLDHSSAGKSGALVRLCETADGFMKDLIQFLRSLRSSALTYQLLVNWFERTWKTLTKADEAGVLVPLLAGLQWPHVVQFTDLLVEKYLSVEKKAVKQHRRSPPTTSGATSSDDESFANQQSVSLVLRQRLLYVIGLALTSKVNKHPALTADEWALCEKSFGLLTRLTCTAGADAAAKGELGEENASLRTVARREMLNVLHRLNESHYRNKLFSPYAESRLVLLKALHAAVAAQPHLQLSEGNETRRMELELVIKKLNKKLRSSVVDQTKTACITFALLLAEKAYCDWQFVSLRNIAVNDVLEGCRNILHSFSKSHNEQTSEDAEMSTVEADCVDVSVDLILSLLLASKKEQDFLRLCFATLAPVLADRHIHKLLDASLDSFALPTDEEDEDEDEADDEDEDNEDDVEGNDDEEDDDADETADPNAAVKLQPEKRKRKADASISAENSTVVTDVEGGEAALSDTEMLALDEKLAQTFRIRIAEKKRREQEQAFPQNVLHLLHDAATNSNTTSEQHCLLIVTLIEVIAQPSPAANLPDKQAQWRKYATQAASILGAFQQRRGDAKNTAVSDDADENQPSGGATDLSPKKLAVTASEACARLIFLRDSAHLANGMNAIHYMLRLLHRSAGEAAQETDDVPAKLTKKQISSMRLFYKNFLEFVGVQKTSSPSSGDSSKNATVNSADFLLQRVSGWLNQNGYGNSVVLPTLAEQALSSVNSAEEAGGSGVTDYRRTQFIQLLTTLTNLAITSAAAPSKLAKNAAAHVQQTEKNPVRDFTAIADRYSGLLLQVAEKNSTTSSGFIHKRWFSTALTGLDQILRKLIAVSTAKKQQPNADDISSAQASPASRFVADWAQSKAETLRNLSEVLKSMQKTVTAEVAVVPSASSVTPPLSVADDDVEMNDAQQDATTAEEVTSKTSKKNKKKNVKDNNHNKQAAQALLAKPSGPPSTAPKKVRALLRRLDDDVKNLLAFAQ